MHDVETSNMFFPMHNHPRSPHIATPSDHDDISRIKLDKVSDLPSLQFKLDGVVDTNERVRVPDSSAVMGDDVRDTFRAYSHFTDFEKFIGGFLGCDTVDGEAAFNIIKEPEVFTRFFNRDDV
jgi:hypothetical protein